MAYTSEGPMVWPLLPNWKRGIEESLEFKTFVTRPTYTGLAQKKRLRIAPRRGFRFEVHPYGDGRRLLENLRVKHGKREWLLPVWQDRQRLAADLAIGATSIPCATAGYDFAADRYALLRRNTLHTTEFEVVQIDSIDPGAINLVAATTQAWGAGTFLYPVRFARLTDDGNRSLLLTDSVSTLAANFEVSEPCDWPAHTFEDAYRDVPVWEFPHNWANSRELGFSRMSSSVDNATSIPVYYDFPDKTFMSLNAAWMSRTREQNALLRSVLYALAGRFASLWVPTMADDLVPAATAEATLTVRYCGYEEFGLGTEGRQDIRIELVDGTVYYRRVTAAAPSGENEVLTLDTALPVAVAPANIRRVSYLARVQQASDSISISHLTDVVATASFVFDGAIEPPAEGA